MSEILDKLPACIIVKERGPCDDFWLVIRKRTAKNIQYIINYECGSIETKPLSTSGIEALNEAFSVIFPDKLFHPNIYDESFDEACRKTYERLIDEKYI